MPIDILNRSHEPSTEELAGSIEGKSREMWRDLTSFIENNIKVKRQIDYSVCSAKPGWNLKYKKSGKALCTLYPEKDFFIALIVLGQADRDLFDLMRNEYCGYLGELYDKTTLFNGTKWLMINVTDQSILNDVKNLIMLKINK